MGAHTREIIMKFSFNQKWVPAGVVLAVAVGLIFTGKLDAEKATAWVASIILALGLESK